MNLRIRFAHPYPRPSFIEKAVEQGTPYLDCETANRELVQANVELLRLRAMIDAREMEENP